MSAKPRDLLKTRSQRVGEVLSNVHLKAGQANGQVVISGCDVAVGTTAAKVKVTAGEVVIAGAIATIALADNQTLAAAATTAAGQFRKVLVEVNAAGAVSFKYGAVSTVDQASALLPAGDADKISVGYLEIPASFTADTTAVTSGMCKDMAYHA
jgi:hypothetical protein